MARLQTQSVRRMRPMVEEAQQTLPKSVDNNVLNSLNYVTKAGAGLAAPMRPQDFSKMETQAKNVMAVMSHMDLRQRALNNEQRMAQSQQFPMPTVACTLRGCRYATRTSNAGIRSSAPSWQACGPMSRPW